MRRSSTVSSRRAVRVIADAKQPSRRAAMRERVRPWSPEVANLLLVAAVLFGFVLRIVQYASNRSLWLDESALTLNIIHLSAAGLLRPLAFSQAAPPGFLLAEKVSTHLFGLSEYSLRLFPLLCSLAALPLFAILARRMLGRWSATLATLLFACAGALIYYGSEVKQYETDVTATIVLLLLGVLLYEQPVRRTRTVAAIAAGGFVVVFFSYAAVFPAVAIAAVLAGRELARRRWQLSRVLVVACAWGLASLLVVIFSRQRTGAILTAFKSVQGAYVGTSPHTLISSLREPPSSLADDLGILPLPSAYYWAAVAVAAVGFVSFARRHTVYAAYFAGATLLMLIASMLHRYPMADRTLLFLVPVAIVLLAEGVARIASAARPGPARRALAAGLSIAVLAVPGWRALSHLANPQKHEEIKSALALLRNDWRPSDTFYVSYYTQFALRYYLECGCFETPRWPFRFTKVEPGQGIPLRSRPPNLVAGLAPLGGRDTFVSEVKKLRGRRRVWLLYSHAGTSDELAYLRGELPRELAAFGRLRKVFLAPGVTLYLYDLRAR